MKFQFIFLISIFFKTTAYSNGSQISIPKKYSISEISQEKYDKISDKNTQNFIDDIKNSGAMGRLVKLSFSQDFKKELGPEKVYEGYFFVLSQAPHLIVENSSSVFAKDLSLQRKIQEYLASATQVVLIPLGRNLNGFVLGSDQIWSKDLISFMFPNGNFQILGLASSANIGTAMHERHHIRQNILGHDLYIIRQQINNLEIDERIKNAAISFIVEFDAYQRAIIEIKNLSVLKPKQKVWRLESLIETQNGYSEYINTFHEDYITRFYELLDEEYRMIMGIYKEYLTEALGLLKENDPLKYCTLIGIIRLVPQSLLKVEDYLQDSINHDSCLM